MKYLIIVGLFAILAFSTSAHGQSPDLKQIDLFVSREGGYRSYRIPSLIRTPGGSILAFCEGRKDNVSDAGNIDLLMRRSDDDGTTWSDVETVVDDGPNTIGNPCPVVDASTKTIWLLLTRNLGQDTEKDSRRHQRRDADCADHAESRRRAHLVEAG